MSVRVDITGINELQQTFNKLGLELQRRIGVRAVSQAAKIIQDEIRARAPVRQVQPGHKAGHRIYWRKGSGGGLRFPGNLKAHIRRRRRKNTAGNKITYEVVIALRVVRAPRRDRDQDLGRRTPFMTRHRCQGRRLGRPLPRSSPWHRARRGQDGPMNSGLELDWNFKSALSSGKSRPSARSSRTASFRRPHRRTRPRPM